jgi:hypothetical protein
LVSETAGNEITVWYATGSYSVDPDAWTVQIQGPGTFKIEATGDNEGLGDIAAITVASYVTGKVDLYIVRDPNEGGGDGAHDVYALDLSGSATTNIQELRISGNLGHDEQTHATAIAGPFAVQKEILSDVYVETLSAGADFAPGALSASLYVTGSGPHAGSITIGELAAEYTIDIQGTITGSIHAGST